METRGDFGTKQVQQLLAPINPARVITGQHVKPHVSQQDVVAHMIRVFGFGHFDVEVLDSVCLFEEPMTNANNKAAWMVAYRALVRVTIRNERQEIVAHYDGGSTGESEGQPSRAASHDLAFKSALSTATKRAAIHLGDQFGLSLYNKGQMEALVRGTMVWASYQGNDVQEGVEQQTEDGGMVADRAAIEAEASQETPEPSAKPAPRKRATNGRQGTKRPAAEATQEPASAPQEAEEAPADTEPAAAAPEPAARPTRDVNAAKAPDALEGETEPDYQNRKRRERDAAEEAERVERQRIADEQTAAQLAREAAEPEPVADPKTGEVIEEDGEQVAARIKRERAERGAPTGGAPEQWTGDDEPWAPVATAPESFDKVRQALPDDYMAQTKAATTSEQLRIVWNESSSRSMATTELRAEIAQRAERIKATEQAAPADDGNALAGA